MFFCERCRSRIDESRILSFFRKARREGLLALEDDVDEVQDEFLKKGIQLVVDGTDPEVVKNILSRTSTTLKRAT